MDRCARADAESGAVATVGRPVGWKSTSSKDSRVDGEATVATGPGDNRPGRAIDEERNEQANGQLWRGGNQIDRSAGCPVAWVALMVRPTTMVHGGSNLNFHVARIFSETRARTRSNWPRLQLTVLGAVTNCFRVNCSTRSGIVHCDEVSAAQPNYRWRAIKNRVHALNDPE